MLIIDRFEGEWALLEWDGEAFKFPRTLLPLGASEGDVVSFEIRVERGATGARRESIKKLEDRLFRE